MIDTNNRNWQFLRNLSKTVNWDKVKAVNRDSYYLENKDNGKKNKYRSRVAMIQLYPENLYDMNFLYEIIVSDGYPYACILHDRDVFTTDKDPDENGNGGHKKGDKKKPHVHVVMCFENGKTNTAVAKMFKINPQFVEMWDCKCDALSYLDHHRYIEKTQYSYDEIYGNLPCETYNVHKDIKDKYLAFDLLVSFILESDYTSMTNVYTYARNHKIIETCLNHWPKLNTLVIEHNEKLKYIEEKKKEGKI